MITVDEAVRALYRGVLGREPDDAGLLANVAALQAGTAFADVVHAFVCSPEATAAAARPDASPEDVELVQQALLARRIDLTRHNAGGGPVAFSSLVSRAVSMGQFEAPAFDRWRELLVEGRPATGQRNRLFADVSSIPHRKLWEWAVVLEAASILGLLAPGRRAIGFGVGTEPLPAALAAHGLDVVATDRPPHLDDHRATAGQHMSALESLVQPGILDRDETARRVGTRFVDMTRLPADLGQADLVWSSCALEHLGTPQAGLRFVLESASLLRPGGVAVHTTELELTDRDATADYGNCAVYRVDDLRALEAEARARGLDVTVNTYVSMDTEQDRWISRVLQQPAPQVPDPAHLKVAIGDSVSTSFALILSRPAQSPGHRPAPGRQGSSR